MMSLLLACALSQVAPGPWDEPLAPVLSQEATAESVPLGARPSFLQEIGRGAFGAYRATMSRAKGANCAFSPSCSVYGHEAIERLGLGPGLLLFGARLMRSHLNFDRFYAFDGVHLVDPLDTTLGWMQPANFPAPWYLSSPPSP